MSNLTPFWLKLMPNFVRLRLEHRSNLLSILHNFGWLLADKIIRISVGLFVTLWIARYLGVEQFGLWNYSIAFASLFSAFSSLGLDGIVVRELVKHPGRQKVLLGSAFLLKLMGGGIALLISLLAIWMLHEDEITTIWLVALSSVGFLFQSVNVIDFYFQSKLKSKFTIYASNAAFVLMSFVKVLLIMNTAPLIAFAWAGLFELALTAIFLIIAYKANNHRINEWRYQKRIILDLLYQSWPLFLAALTVTLYMKIDMIMLKEMSNDWNVGIYSAATKFSEVWYFLPIIIVASVSPSIIKYHSTNSDLYLKKLSKLYFFMAWLAIGLSLPLSLFSDQIMRFFLGEQFVDAAPILALHLWASLAVFLGVASSQYLVAENLQKISFYRTLIGLIFNILLNIMLIPKLGAMGAALATVISYFIATFSIIFFKVTRQHGFVLLKAPLLKIN